MTFSFQKMILSRHTLKKKDPRSAFIPIGEPGDSYAVYSTDADDIAAMKQKAYDDRRARQAEGYLAKHGFAGGIGGGALRGLR